MDKPTDWRRFFWWLRSRKVQTALATIVVAVAADAGLDLNEGAIVAVLAVGVAVILGIALEDAGEKSAGKLLSGTTKLRVSKED
jgi:hypothetical protein